jgi:GDP-4-dehydro-6-deoxy-D-mannose reductase
MRVLITGASGFTGNFMLELLSRENSIEIFALRCNNSAKEFKKTRWIECNLLNRAQILEIIHGIMPDRIIHLAGLNHGQIEKLIQVNVLGTENLLQAVQNGKNNCRTLVIGSSAEYGYAGKTPITESTSFNPVSDYAVSKVTEELLSISYFFRYNLPIAVARPFNLIGPLQSPSFVCGRIISQIVEIENGLKKDLYLHDIESCRDFIDVRDAVQAYWSILNHRNFLSECSGKSYNVGSGRAYSISDVINIIWKIIGKEYPITIVEKTEPILIPSQVSDNTLIKQITSWEPRIPINKSLHDMLIVKRKETENICT